MDPSTLITIAASVAAILAFLYVAIFGSRSLTDWWRERQAGRASQRTRPPSLVQHNLPHMARIEFVNRDVEFAKLLTLLSPESRHFVLSIEGFPGVGKTALALEIGHHHLNPRPSASANFDAIVWASAKRELLMPDGLKMKEKTHLTFDDLLTTIAIVLKRDEITKARREEQPEAIRSALAEKRTLLILDNQEAIDDLSIVDFLQELLPRRKS